MAVDEALLDAVDADPTSAVLRTYEWTVPTLSLGYFQSIAEVETDPRWQGVAVVRRPTGGGALWHHHEVTYALVVPRSLEIARRPVDLYRAVHAAIAECLRSLGIEAGRRGEGRPGVRRERPFLCFLDQDPEDVVFRGSKVVGSAQRRRPRAVLQHGALLLGRSERTPELAGLADLTGVDAKTDFWTNRLKTQICDRLRFESVSDELSIAEQRLVVDRESAVYRNQAWTRKR
jgi:lipoate-protein ligase A